MVRSKEHGHSHCQSSQGEFILRAKKKRTEKRSGVDEGRKEIILLSVYLRELRPGIDPGKTYSMSFSLRVGCTTRQES